MMQGEWPVWIAESDRVAWDVQKKISRPRAKLDAAMQAEEKRLSNNKNSKPTPGLTFHVTPRIMDGGTWPTLEEWIDEQEAKKGKAK